MGKAMSFMMKPVKTFNIENRAHKIISRDKPVRAPLHEKTKKQIEIAEEMDPTFMEEHNKKDAGLDQRLKNVYVESHDTPSAFQETENPNRPLPTLTRSGEDFEYGFWEPGHCAEGKCTLRTVVTFLVNHHQNPIENPAKEIAQNYKLDPKDVDNILTYYRVFKLVPQADYLHFDVLAIDAETKGKK